MTPYTILYVERADEAAGTYEALLGTRCVERQPTFALMPIPSGGLLGLWSKDGVEPPAGDFVGGSELSFSVATETEVDDGFARWRSLGVTVLQEPASLDFGYSATVSGPGGHRLRLFSPRAA